MNRFFRSALFPLIVIVLLVYLASQTLMRGGGKEVKLSTAQFIQKVQGEPAAISNVVIDPNKQKISFKIDQGEGLEGGSVHYASSQDEHQIQNQLQQHRVDF